MADITEIMAAVDRPEVVDAIVTILKALPGGMQMIVAIVAPLDATTGRRAVALLEPGKDASANLAAAEALQSLATMDGRGEMFRTLN